MFEIKDDDAFLTNKDCTTMKSVCSWKAKNAQNAKTYDAKEKVRLNELENYESQLNEMYTKLEIFLIPLED